MEMLLAKPTNQHQDNYSGDTKLAYVMECGTQPIAIDKDEYGDLLVTIDEDGLLMFNYFHSEMSFHYEDPPDEVNIMFYLQCAAVEAAKGIAEIVLMDIEHTTSARWKELGFVQEIV